MAERPTILIVDDDPDLCESLQIILEANDLVVRTAHNSREAMAVIAERLPDLMILDVMMDTLTEGFALAHELKSNPRTAELPIILLTCFLDKVRRDGPDEFQHILGEDWQVEWMFEKPADTNRLLQKIRSVLGERIAQRPAGGQT